MNEGVDNWVYVLKRPDSFYEWSLGFLTQYVPSPGRSHILSSLLVHSFSSGDVLSNGVAPLSIISGCAGTSSPEESVLSVSKLW